MPKTTKNGPMSSGSERQISRDDDGSGHDEKTAPGGELDDLFSNQTRVEENKTTNRGKSTRESAFDCNRRIINYNKGDVGMGIEH